MTSLEARVDGGMPNMYSWEALTEAPPFRDQWEEYTQGLPNNMTLVHHIGLRSYWETLFFPIRGSKQYRLYNHHFAAYGSQLPEEEFADAFQNAKELCNLTYQVLHVRYDMRGRVEETWQNAPFRYITGHSFHKIPKSELETDYVNVDGQWWHKHDYAEVLYRQELEKQ